MSSASGPGGRRAARPPTGLPSPFLLLGGCVPEYIRSDNGPEFVAQAVQEWIARRGFKTLHIKPGSPWQNAYSESFKLPVPGRVPKPGSVRLRAGGKSARQKCSAKSIGKEHRQRHNHQRPHSPLEYQTPVESAQRSLAAASATLRQPQGCALPTNHITPNPKPENHEKLS